jgi:hypothetical protein
LFSALSYAFYVLSSKKIISSIGSVLFTAIAMSASSAFVLFLCQYMYDYESMSFDERNNTIVLDGHLVTVFWTYYAGK